MLTWLVDRLKVWSKSLAGKAEYLEQLDADTKAKINADTKRAFWSGMICLAIIEAGIYLLVR